jgi:putative ABC transport system permease protein
MLSNYLKIAIRSLFKNKAYSFINIAGLALGLACVCIIVQYLTRELSYDRFHDGAENIYRIAWEDANPQTRTPHPMAQAMVRDFPEVESAVSLTPPGAVGLMRRTFSFRNPEKDIRFDEKNILAVDTTFFDVFTFPMVIGDGKQALKNPGGLLISESMAKKYFGDENPVGKQLSVNDDRYIVEVAGVFKDVPETSHFHFDFLVSYIREKSLDDPKSKYYTWQDFGHYNYIRLKPGANAKELEEKLAGWLRQYIDISDETFNNIKANGYGFRLQPITDIHLRSHLLWELETNGYIAYIYIMVAAAFLILFIGCVNFINLSTAQSAERAKEIGIRKSLGAFRGQLALQFTGESVLVSLLAAMLAAIILEASIPFFGMVTGSTLTLSHSFFLSVLMALGLLVGVLAGVFPSFFLASAKPGAILKGKILQNPGGAGFRQAFTTFQFFASMILISSSIIIYSQIRFIQTRELGFDQEETVILPLKNRNAITPKLDELRNELLKVPGIKAVSAASNVPGTSYNQNPVFATANPGIRGNASESLVDYDFFDAMGIEFVEGRKFSRENTADKEAFIINETAANNLYPEGALGKELSWDFDDAGIVEGTIIGIVKDFHFQSLHEPVRPLLFRLLPYYRYVVVKLNTDDLSSTLKGVETTWKKFDNRFEFEFSFLKEDLNKQYSQEQNMASVLMVFSIIAMTIACFGLLAIAALTFRQKTKEISVRKVLGASLSSLAILLVRDFTRIVLVAIVLAVPLVWWLMNGWLENFTFRTTINPLIFVGSGVLLIAIAWVTLSYLTIKIARVNPAQTLKSE